MIYCVGNHPVQVAKECYDRKTLALNIQENMAVTLAENNKNTVMVVISSYPYSICNENEKVPAIIYTTHAGQHLGTAVSEAVFGKLNPAGRLPLTWYKSENDLPDIMEYDIEKGETTYMYFKGEPLYPFGYGLSYTEFEYSDFKVEKTADGISGKVNVKNVGETDGDEVVEIYYTVKNSAVTRPDVKLCGFERVFIKAGETKEVSVKIPEHILRFFDVRTKTMQIEKGEYTFYVGASCKDLRGEYALFIDGYTVKNRSDSFDADSYEACDNVKILFSKNLERNYVRCLGWGGNVTYGGVSVRDKNKLVVTAQSTVKQANMDIFFDDEKVSVSINPSDALDGFYEYEIDIPQNTADVCTVKIRLEGDCAMLDLKLI
ncbi:MAG: glycoside hydrolase family 3 C-terminal domain-containing protein [Oscillospiraceae bacterium]|nr:glycoside hydrolase family 3 C-terminal domain-containing protein [Oscillospiraceae bacterium]